MSNDSDTTQYLGQHDVERSPSLSPQSDYLPSHGLWDKDQQSAKARRAYFKIVPPAVVLVVVIIIWGVLPIYWGSLWKAPEHLHNLNGWIVDHDGGEIGQAVTRALLATNGPPTSITWSIPPQLDTLDDNLALESAVVDEHAWVIVAINPDASINLNNAIASSNSSYDSSLAVTLWVNEARNVNAYRMFYPIVEAIMQQLEQTFALHNAAQLNSTTTLSKLLSAAPQTVTTPLGHTTFNTRPFDVPIVTAVNYVGMIYLTIIAFVTCMINYNAIMTGTGLYRRLKLSHVLMLRLGFPFIAYFVLSAFYALLSLAFAAPFTRWYGGSGFVIYWMMAWVAMLALGFAIDSMLTILTPRFLPFFLILWIVANVSAAFYPVELLPKVFRYAYASPFYNLSRTVLTICFNTKNQFGLNFAVQIIWIVVSVCTLTIFQCLVRKRDEKAWKREYEQKQGKGCPESEPVHNDGQVRTDDEKVDV